MKRINQTDLTVSPTLRRLLIHLQDRCSADCCHLLAFTVQSENVRKWLETERIDRFGALSEEIALVASRLARMEGRVYFDIRDLESTWNVPEALELFEMLELEFLASSTNKKAEQASAWRQPKP